MSQQFSIPVLFALIGFFLADSENLLIKQLFDRSLLIGNRTLIEAKLAQLGRTQPQDFENFRISQLTYIFAGFAISTLIFLMGQTQWFIYTFSLVLISFAVFAITEKNLTRRCQRRLQAIEGEFPAVIEMLTLAVGAGESPASALKRISIRAQGHIASEFRQVISEIEDGRSLISALDDLSRRLASDSIRRFVDSLAISISRGSSLVETLTHSANESRNQERVRLLAAAGKSEIAMMIPVVFLILPVSILFALYPSLNNLNLFGGS
jgi:tight adherence protein C